MKIIKIGTFNEQGNPINWHLDACGVTDDLKTTKYGLGIIKDKVYVNGVEIVEWTEKRREIMTETAIWKHGRVKTEKNSTIGNERP